MNNLIKQMNLHKCNVEGDFIISEEKLTTFAENYYKEKLKSLDKNTSYLIDELERNLEEEPDFLERFEKDERYNIKVAIIVGAMWFRDDYIRK